MEDRELLERAARAAGIEVKGVVEDADGRLVTLTVNDRIGAPRYRWNPLTNDADAFRLAVKLRITVKQDDPDAAIAGIADGQYGAPTLDKRGPWYRKEWHGDYDGDPYAATRRAIVRAAASMGE